MRIFRLVAMLAIAVCCVPGLADAHPLGNFTHNHLSRVTVTPNGIAIHYVYDEAEIPTFQELRTLDAHGTPSQAQLNAWAQGYANTLVPQLVLRLDGKPAGLTVADTHVSLRPGAVGLKTLYLTADYRAARAAGTQHVQFDDATLPGRIGWKDVVVSPQHEPTNELRTYPNALIGSPRDRTSVAFTATPSGASDIADLTEAPIAGVQSAERMNDLTDVLNRNLADPLVLLGALLIAIGLGALHALEPGHGKTLLAISLVGARATVSQAFILASSLTVAHTFGVLLFGAVVLTLARYIVPETLYPWMALLSGIFVAVLGARALAREVVRRRDNAPAFAAHGHDHGHAHGDHTHAHDDFAKSLGATQVRYHGYADANGAHDHDDLDDEAHARAHAIPGTAPLSFRSALIAATTGNVAPCPAALVVLLAAIATHRIAYGMILIVAFSIGLALTLTLLGVAVVRGAAWLTKRPQFDRFARFAPLFTAGVISIIGAWMIGEGVTAQGVVGTPIFVALAVLATIVAFTAIQTFRHTARPTVAA